MATEQEILDEVEKLGRLSDDQEVMLYNICLRQDELGREQSNILLSQIESNPLYKEPLERELLTYQVFNHGKKAAKNPIASLYVTLKGIRYCIMYGEEIMEKRPFDVAGRLRKKPQE